MAGHPVAKRRSTFVARSQPDSARCYFVSIQSDKAQMDLYEADADQRGIREVACSKGGVVGWLIDSNRRLAGRVRKLGADDGADRAVELLQPDGPWRLLRTLGGFDAYGVQRIDTQAGEAWISSNIGHDKIGLFELDLTSGTERVLARDAQVDLGGAAFAASDGGPIGFYVEPGLPKMA